jgi:primary-amine oxidase
MNKFKITLAFIMTALLMLMTHWSFAPVTAADENDCSQNYQVDVTLPTGTTWTMCWEERQNEGIVLRDIELTLPGGSAQKILFQTHLAELHVPYDDNGARFHDVTQFGLGGHNLLDLTADDCLGGTLLQNNGKDVLCMKIAPREYAYKYQGNVLQGDALTLFSVSAVGQYNYIVEWNFWDDGTINPKVGATGKLQRFGTDAEHGWLVNDSSRPYGISHTHNYYFYMDFDLVDQHNDTVEQIEFDQSADGRRFSISQSDITTETGRQVEPTKFRSWRIKNTAVSNSDGHPISYHLEAEPQHLFHGPDFEDWTHNDLYVTRYKACEKWIVNNPTTGGCGQDVTEFVNGESVLNTDVVIWYGLTFHHLARDEDENHMDTHWSSFVMTPRDWTATNPLDGVVRATPTVIASPTATPVPKALFCSSNPLAIPDNGSITTTLTIPDSGTIADLDVSLDATHTWVGDLSFTLTHDGTGTSSTIVDRPGIPGSDFGCGEDNIDAILDDEATSAVENECSVPTAIAGTFSPNQLLGLFNGENITGDWTLTISDNAPQDTGTLNEFCLIWR